jgi:hypothetical protein
LALDANSRTAFLDKACAADHSLSATLRPGFESEIVFAKPKSSIFT